MPPPQKALRQLAVSPLPAALYSCIPSCKSAGNTHGTEATYTLALKYEFLFAGWAIYKEQHVLWALLLFLCQTVWAAGRTGQRVLDHVSD